MTGMKIATMISNVMRSPASNRGREEIGFGSGKVKKGILNEMALRWNLKDG